jgi:hypothetical protein
VTPTLLRAADLGVTAASIGETVPWLPPETRHQPDQLILVLNATDPHQAA